MKDFKSTDKRLAGVFLRSRDSWKEKAMKRHQKIRALEIKIRDLGLSRDSWKDKAKIAREEVKQLKVELSELKKKEENENEIKDCSILKEAEIVTEIPKKHIYPIYIIFLAVAQIISSLSSFRGVQKTFESFNEIFLNMPTPTYGSVRKWTLRLGLYELQKKREFRKDWIFIVDTTIELGKAKCLVVLGISQEKFRQITEGEQRSLNHKDMEVLTIEVMKNCNGVLVEEKLRNLSDRVGTPKQIVADRGSDIKKGIELYRDLNPEVIYTYDVTHQMANLLKKELSSDKKYQEFVGECLKARQEIQQTDLYFLIPPKQRAKARDNNMDIWVKWGIEILKYQKKNDFKEISDCFAFDEKAREKLQKKLSKSTRLKLEKIKGKVFKGRKIFREEIANLLELKTYRDNEAIICQACDLGRRRFEEKLGWVKKYEEDLTVYSQILEIVRRLFKQVKNQGLNKESPGRFETNLENLKLQNRSDNFKNKVLEYLQEQTDPIKPGETLLSSSDILESILGKYKNFSTNSPLKEIGKMLLTIPLSTIEIAATTVKEAMEKIRYCDVDDWADKVFGPSMLSKRRAITN